MASQFHLMAALIALFLTNTISAASYKSSSEKLSHFQFYWHDTQSGSHPSCIPILKPLNSTTGFGGVNMIDNPMTETHDVTSKLLGRSQGLYGLASQEQTGLIMAMNFVFVEGKYNGSSFTVLGRNMVRDNVREMPVVGGTGRFRFARGYVEARTYSFNIKTLDGVIQFDCYILHF